MLRVGERERRCSHGLRMIWILEEQDDCEVQFPDDVRVFIEQHVEAFSERALSVVRVIDRSEHVREFFRRPAERGEGQSFRSLPYPGVLSKEYIGVRANVR